MILSTAREGKGLFTPSVKIKADNSAMTLATLLSLKTMESLQNGGASHFQATPLFSMRTVLLVSLQNCRSFDADAWCEWALMFSQAFVILSTIGLIATRSLLILVTARSVRILLVLMVYEFILGGCGTGTWKNVF